MITVFQSKAAGDVIMFGDVARKMLELMGKECTDKGIITLEQLPGAIDSLERAIAADKAELAGKEDEELPLFELTEDGGKRPYVSLSQRGAPLLELCKRSLNKKVPVVWGV